MQILTIQQPEVSYGTHFFQDLVEGQIIYLPVYPDDPKTMFNSSFFEGSPNILTDLLPDSRAFKDVVKIIDVPKAAGGTYAKVVADPQSHSARLFHFESETKRQSSSLKI